MYGETIPLAFATVLAVMFCSLFKSYYSSTLQQTRNVQLSRPIIPPKKILGKIFWGSDRPYYVVFQSASALHLAAYFSFGLAFFGIFPLIKLFFPANGGDFNLKLSSFIIQSNKHTSQLNPALRLAQ